MIQLLCLRFSSVKNSVVKAFPDAVEWHLNVIVVVAVEILLLLCLQVTKSHKSQQDRREAK